MVASPADLVSGRPFTGIDAMPAVSAVERYLTDKITPPPAPDGLAVCGAERRRGCRGRCGDGRCSGRRRPVTLVGLRRYWLRHRAISDLRNVFARLLQVARGRGLEFPLVAMFLQSFARRVLRLITAVPVLPVVRSCPCRSSEAGWSARSCPGPGLEHHQQCYMRNFTWIEIRS